MTGQLSSEVRIGTIERERAATDLGEHLAAGRLSTDEFDERVRRAYAARTATELEPLFRDLPDLRPAATPRPRRDLRPLFLVLVIAAVVAWVAFLHVPPFFIFPLMWFAFAGRRFGGRGGRGGFGGPRGPGRSFVGNR
ncbi:MAG TPA: DUF1707 domain-containing protein [Jatrophihabitantaceae bacterium]|jgi:hypothetical protein